MSLGSAWEVVLAVTGLLPSESPADKEERQVNRDTKGDGMSDRTQGKAES